MKNRRLRSWLTILGIVVGVAAIVSLIALGQGLENSIEGQFSKIGADFITIMPGASTFGPPGYTTAKLTDDDVKAIESIKEVDFVSPNMISTEKVRYGREELFLTVAGVKPEAVTTLFVNKQGFKVIEGRPLSEDDRWATFSGYGIARDYFDKKIKTGSSVEIRGRKFKVVGILEEVGLRQRDGQLTINIEDARELFGRKNYDTIIVLPKQGQKAEDVAELIKRKLKRERGEEDFQVYTSKQLLESIGSILNIVQIILVGVAAISLIVGGIGIMNSMYTSVLERTKEIGILKAIGASNNNILSMFLVEAGIVGAAGGTAGAVLGIGVGKLVEIAASYALGSDYLTVSCSPQLIAFAILFAFGVGCLSGFLPARNAANMDPVKALRWD